MAEGNTGRFQESGSCDDVGIPLDELESQEERQSKVLDEVVAKTLKDSLGYIYDFAKFMVGVVTVVLTAYLALLKLYDAKSLIFPVLLPFLVALASIVVFLFALFPWYSRFSLDEMLWSIEWHNTLLRRKRWLIFIASGLFVILLVSIWVTIGWLLAPIEVPRS